MEPLRDLDSVDFCMQFVNEVLSKLHVLFRNCFDFQSISPQLRSHNLLTKHEWEVISKKDSREEQVDEFLKRLPHKGRNCLHQLIKCLQLSLDHAGHQDLLIELKKLVEKQADDSRTADGSSQNEFHKVVTDFTTIINSLYLSETKKLKEKIEEQDGEIKNLQLTCSDHAATIQQLKDTISTLQSSNDDLKTQLQDKEKLLERFNSNSTVDFESDVSLEEISFETCEEEASCYKRASSLSYSFSSSSIPLPEASQKRYSDIPNKHPKVTRNLSIEDRLKAYQDKLEQYRKKCQSLEMDKKALKQDKLQLNLEVSTLKEQLDTLSITSHGSTLSRHKSISYSCSSLEKDSINHITVRDESNKIIIEGNSPSYFSRLTSMIKNPGKRASKISPEPQENNILVSTEVNDKDKFMSAMLSEEDYLNPIIYQSWLMKEGGHKKSLRKRWCILSSRFFFYFEGKEDLKRPLGMLPLTQDMEVADSAKENGFEIFNKSRTNMKSCKLDKNKSGYAPGNHTVYSLQASCSDEKNKWIENFQKVFKSLQVKPE